MIRHAVLVAALALATGGVHFSSAGAESSSSLGGSVIITTAPRHATEGDRIKISTKVGSPRSAERVQLQERQVDIFGNASWVTVRSAAVRGDARHTFSVVAEGLNRERYRARVTYRQAKPSASQPVAITIWRWIPLTNYRPYYSTPGSTASQYSSFPMNGREYLGWYTYSNDRSWEARYTTGRNCKAFRGELGVRDESSDGSQASITLLTEEDQVLYESPSLAPGAVTKVELRLAMPYRFSIRATDLSADKLHALPAIGDPAFLCTGI